MKKLPAVAETEDTTDLEAFAAKVEAERTKDCLCIMKMHVFVTPQKNLVQIIRKYHWIIR